jgi:hypothetical protein
MEAKRNTKREETQAIPFLKEHKNRGKKVNSMARKSTFLTYLSGNCHKKGPLLKRA